MDKTVIFWGPGPTGRNKTVTFRDSVLAKLLRLVFALAAILLSFSVNSSYAGIVVNDYCKMAVEVYNEATLSNDLTEKETLFKRAITFCEKCDKPEILSKVYNNLANLYEEKGETSTALVHYRQAIKIKNDLVTPYISVGNIFFKLGDYYSAFVMYEKALKIKADDEDSQKGRGKAEAAYKEKMIIYFERDSAKIAEEYTYRLQLMGDVIKNSPKGKIQIIGHTCDLGSKAYNKRLSQKRAKAVVEYLNSNHFINGDEIVAIARGKECPILPNKDDEARILNRRVEVIIQ